ncbi:MAG: hypothetical protein O2915_05545 [Proteobacteria bacterium]|nr:hypothetical protein [Pseudomonadota bacterium]MDA0873219.1 hypothetical protein [Pseudomonadota bacterium]
MIFLKKEFKLNSSESYHYAKKIQYFLFEKCHLGTNRMQDTYSRINMHYILGGIAIRSAVSILLIFNGRIFGISGIIRGFLKNPFAEMSWRLFFILGLNILLD